MKTPEYAFTYLPAAVDNVYLHVKILHLQSLKDKYLKYM